ncbi:MAG TPA: hypothetical protein VHC95_03280 [Opitutales bacterium]|nr:hypothetical protein [Opitutales bacterium]
MDDLFMVVIFSAANRTSWIEAMMSWFDEATGFRSAENLSIYGANL